MGSLSLRDLCFTYDEDLVKGVQHHRIAPDEVPEEKLVLKHLDLEVADGEFLCLVGHSGSGNRRRFGFLLVCKSRSREPSRRTATQSKAPVSTGPVVFQNYSLFPW